MVEVTVGGVLATVLIVLAMGVSRALSRIDKVEQRTSMLATRSAPRPYDDQAIREALQRMGKEIEHQNLAIAEGIDRVTRAENRVAETVRRARARMARAGYVDPAIEAEADELRDEHGEGSPQGELLPMPEIMGEDPDGPSPIPGVTNRQFKAFYGG